MVSFFVTFDFQFEDTGTRELRMIFDAQSSIIQNVK